jgi:cyclic pyranopterin monophosphate synthase
MPNNPRLSHIDDSGHAHMVDVSDKSETIRWATASGEVHMLPGTLELIKLGLVKKGDVLTVAQIAGILGAKKTSELIPLCHPISLQQVEVKLDIIDELPGIKITATAKTSAKTGVEMEALTAVSVAALTVYDMIKAAEKTAIIQNIHLVEKHGGRSGDVIIG